MHNPINRWARNFFFEFPIDQIVEIERKTLENANSASQSRFTFGKVAPSLSDISAPISEPLLGGFDFNNIGRLFVILLTRHVKLAAPWLVQCGPRLYCIIKIPLKLSLYYKIILKMAIH